jgi:cytochrome P450
MIDLSSSKSFVSGHPLEQYRWLRENAPVYRHEEPDGPGFWVVTTHELVREVSTHLEFLRIMMLAMDPPRHTQHRRLIGGAFTPKRAAQWRDSISETARPILDEVCERGECDLVTDIAGKLPSYVIAELLGIPRADGVRLYDLSEIIHSASNVVSEDERSAAMGAEVDGQGLTEQEFSTFFMLLLNGGGALAPTAVEELLRFQSPLIHLRRTALRDTELGGTRIAAGDKVVMYFGAANPVPGHGCQISTRHRLDLRRRGGAGRRPDLGNRG